MAEIVKELNLNGNPDAATNYSIVCAKNIMVDRHGNYLSIEPGLSIAFTTPNQNEEIVGFISCIEELVIFTYDKYDDISRIYRYNPVSNNKTEVYSNWTYCGGKIHGSFYYNYKKELIIAIAEYTDNEDINVYDYPLKTINLNTCSVNDHYIYSTEENIKPFHVRYTTDFLGHLVCGTYTYFIRFVINDTDYTKWFQITDDIHIIYAYEKEAPYHNVRTKYTVTDETGNNLYAKVTPSIVPRENTSWNDFVINDNKISSTSINLYFEYPDDFNFDKFQLGYIVKRGTDIKARIQGEYKIENNKSNNKYNDYNVYGLTIYNNDYLDELLIDSLLDNPNQLYNVKSLYNYENRLYVANYSTYKNEDLNNIAKNCNITFHSVDNIKLDIDTTKYWEQDINYIRYYIPFRTFPYEDEALYYNSIDKEECYAQLKSSYNDDSVIEDYIIKPLCNTEFRIYNNADMPVYIIPIYTEYVTSMTELKNNPLNNLSAALGLVVNFESNRNNPYHPEGAKMDIIFLDYAPAANANVITNSPFPFGETIDKTVFNTNFEQSSSLSNTDLLFTTNGLIYKYYGGNIIDYYTSNNQYNLNSDDNNPNPIRFIIILACYMADEHWSYHYITQPWKTNTNDPSTIYGEFYSNNWHSNPTEAIAWNAAWPIKLNIKLGIKSFSQKNALNSVIRCPLPKQAYNVFIHYIRKDKSYTDGFHVKLLFDKYCDYGNASYIQVNANVPDGYIGYFLSYEELIPSSSFVHVEETSNKQSRITNTEFIYRLEDIQSGFTNSNLNSNQLDNSKLSSVKSIIKSTQEPHVIVEHYGSNDFTKNQNAIIYFKPEYKKETKILYRLTDDIYSETNPWNEDLSNIVNNEDYSENKNKLIYYSDSTNVFPFKYWPSYVSISKAITYPKEVSCGIGMQFAYNGEGKKYGGSVLTNTSEDNSVEGMYTMKFWDSLVYSRFPLSAMHCDVDYQEGVTVINKDNGDYITTVYNKILSPAYIPKFLSLDSNYQSKPDKIYTNYNKNHQSNFYNTIYRSDVNSDESLTNGFRTFRSNNYKIIHENTGKIINMFYYNDTFYIHLEHSLYKIDRTEKLKNFTGVATEIPDVFDLNYKVVIDNGSFAIGLRNKEECILTNEGYIWYNYYNNSIYLLRDKLTLLSKDIDNLINKREVEKVRFAYDNYYSRLLISIFYKDGEIITISFSFVTNTFISLHDYYFTDATIIANKTLLFNKDEDKHRLYIFDENSDDLYSLAIPNINNNLYDYYEYGNRIPTSVI